MIWVAGIVLAVLADFYLKLAGLPVNAAVHHQFKMLYFPQIQHDLFLVDIGHPGCLRRHGGPQVDQRDNSVQQGDPDDEQGVHAIKPDLLTLFEEGKTGLGFELCRVQPRRNGLHRNLFPGENKPQVKGIASQRQAEEGQGVFQPGGVRLQARAGRVQVAHAAANAHAAVQRDAGVKEAKGTYRQQ